MYTTYIIFHSAVTMSVKDVTISSTEIRILLLVVLLLVDRIHQYYTPSLSARRRSRLGEGHSKVEHAHCQSEATCLNVGEHDIVIMINIKARELRATLFEVAGNAENIKKVL